MVQIITASNSHLYPTELDGMYRDRKRVFVDWLKWKIPVVDGVREIDKFDNADAIYLLASESRTRKHIASLRLLPTDRPHLFSTVFSNLCEGEIPAGEDTFELTRFCVSPDVAKPVAHRLRDMMWVACVEYAVTHGIRKYTCVTHIQFLSQILAAGWEAEPLGMPQKVDGGEIGAVLLHISPETLADARQRYGYRTAILEGDLEAKVA